MTNSTNATYQNKSGKHWIVMLICCGMAISSIGLPVNAGGVFFTPVAESLGVLRGTFSIHATLTLIGTAVVSLFVPALIKKFSLKGILTVGTATAVLSTVLMGFTRSLPMFFLLGALRGLGAGLFGMVPLTLIVNAWFEKQHGLVTSIVVSFTGIGGALFSPVFAYLIEAIGWEYSYVVMGIVMLVCNLPAVLYPFSLNPRNHQLLPYGYEEETESGSERQTQRTESGNIKLSVFFLLFAFGILHTMITGIPQHFPGYAETINYTLSVGSMMLSAGMLGNIFFKLIVGIISDRMGPVKATLSMIGLNVVSIVLLLMAPNTTMLLVSSFLFGSVYCVPAVGVTLLTREFFGVGNFGKVYPIITFAVNIGGAFSLSLVGYVFDFTGSYVPAFLISLVFHAVNVLFILFAAKKTRDRNVEVQAHG